MSSAQGSRFRVRGLGFSIDAPARRKAARLVPGLLGWFSKNARDLPWRRTQDPYAIWVSEIMLQQTQVRTVIPHYERWMKALPSIQSLALASSQRLHKLWEGLGYYTRVRNLQRAARVICREHDGRFPDQFEPILALPGIGRYTAGAICSIALNQPTPILDGNVIRVLTRVFGIGGDPKEKRTNALLWQLAEALVTIAGERARDSDMAGPIWASIPCSALNQSLMELGATVCTPRNPACPACPIRRSCFARRNGIVDALPALKSRPPTTHRRMQAYVIRNQHRYLATQRPHDGVNSGLWEFPSLEVDPHGTAARKPASRVAGIALRNSRLLGTIRHSITRYRITVEVYGAEPVAPAARAGAQRRWLTPAELRRLPFSAAHRRIADTLLVRGHERATGSTSSHRLDTTPAASPTSNRTPGKGPRGATLAADPHPAYACRKPPAENTCNQSSL